MKARHPALFLVATLLVLAPLALASPPDPSWVGGLWDGADLDEVVLLLAGTSSVAAPPIAGAADRLPLVAVIGAIDDSMGAARAASTAVSRAPPAM